MSPSKRWALRILFSVLTSISCVTNDFKNVGTPAVSLFNGENWTQKGYYFEEPSDTNK